MAENDVKALHISKRQRNVSTITSKIQDLLATLKADDSTLGTHASEVLEALHDDCVYEDYHLLFKKH